MMEASTPAMMRPQGTGPGALDAQGLEFAGFQDLDLPFEGAGAADGGVDEAYLASDQEPSSDGDDAPGSTQDEGLWEALEAQGDLLNQVEREALYDELREIGMYAFLEKHIGERRTPLRKLLLQFGVYVPPDEELSSAALIHLLKMAISRVLRNRKRLPDYKTFDDAVQLLRGSKKILILTGAGVSTSCGIPDFRSSDGLYAQLQEQGFDQLDDPQQMFDIEFFREDPRIFFSFARHIFPSNFAPSPCHRFVKLIEEKGRLLRNYTQNIDTLETQAGVKRALQCHGSFATATCLKCRRSFPGSTIQDDILSGRVAVCPVCPSLPAPAKSKASTKPKSAKQWEESGSDDDQGRPVSEYAGAAIVKPDITFFGEKLSDAFDHSLLADREDVDLLLVIGTSLQVAPVSEILSHIPHRVPQVLINRDPVTHFTFDVCLLGDADVIVQEICKRAEELGDAGESWSLEAMKRFELARTGGAGALEREGAGGAAAEGSGTVSEARPRVERVGDTHIWLFPGANRDHKWVRAARNASETPSASASASPGGQPVAPPALPASRSRLREGDATQPDGAEDDEVQRGRKRHKNEH